MSMVETIAACPSSFDIEPTCFDVNPTLAVRHAESICEQMGMPSTSIRFAMGLMIPSRADSSKILYGFRNPEFHTEYKSTWGLPSVGMSREEFLDLDQDADVATAVVNKLTANKLDGVELAADRLVGWTGRLRGPNVDPQFTEPYYLIMVNLATTPADPTAIPNSTQAYLNLEWLTPEEHADVVTTSPKKACGACSQLALAVSHQDKL